MFLFVSLLYDAGYCLGYDEFTNRLLLRQYIVGLIFFKLCFDAGIASGNLTVFELPHSKKALGNESRPIARKYNVWTGLVWFFFASALLKLKVG